MTAADLNVRFHLVLPFFFVFCFVSCPSMFFSFLLFVVCIFFFLFVYFSFVFVCNLVFVHEYIPVLRGCD